MCSGALPTTNELHGRIDNISSLCLRCDRFEESAIHAVWGCSFSAKVWEVTGIDKAGVGVSKGR